MSLELYEKVASMIDDEHTEFIRHGEDQNVDQIISKAALIYYCNRQQIDRIEQEGILSPAKLLETYPNSAQQIQSVFQNELQDQLLSNAVCCFFSRIPTTLTNTSYFLHYNAPVKISIDKLNKADETFEIYLINHPLTGGKPLKLDNKKILKFVKSEGIWFKYFKRSTDGMLRDVPRAAIVCPSGVIPSFACKILKNANKESVY